MEPHRPPASAAARSRELTDLTNAELPALYKLPWRHHMLSYLDHSAEESWLHIRLPAGGDVYT